MPAVPILLSELAARLGCRLIGDGATPITGVAGMEHATSGQLTFLANPKYAHKVKAHPRRRDSAGRADPGARHCLNLFLPIRISISRALLALFYQPPRPKSGVHPTASVAASARIGENASIGAFAVVGEKMSHRAQRRAASARGDL